MKRYFYFAVCILLAGIMVGCRKYSTVSLYPDNVQTIYVEMFDNDTFRRGQEYELTDAIAKRIEAETPYKIISSRDEADTLITGKLIDVSEGLLSMESETGRPLEKQAVVAAEFSWKDLRSGDYLIEKQTASATAAYVPFQQQSFDYASRIALNKLAERIVEQMRQGW